MRHRATTQPGIQLWGGPHSLSMSDCQLSAGQHRPQSSVAQHTSTGTCLCNGRGGQRLRVHAHKHIVKAQAQLRLDDGPAAHQRRKKGSSEKQRVGAAADECNSPARVPALCRCNSSNGLYYAVHSAGCKH